MELNDYIAKINKLESAALGSNTAATNLRRDLALAYYNLGYYDKAEYQFKQILPAFEQIDGQNSLDYISAKIDLANTVSRLGRYQEGHRMAQDAHILARRFSPGSSLYQNATDALANSFGFLDDRRSEEKLYRDLVQITLTTSGPKHRKTIEAIRNLCFSMIESERYPESEGLLRVALELSFNATDMDGLEQEQCIIRCDLGRCFYHQGKYAESEFLLRETAKISEKLLGVEHEETSRCKLFLFAVLRTQDLLSESHDILLETIEVHIKKLKEIRGQTITAMANLSVVLVEMRKTDDAYKWMKQALCYCVEIGVIDNDRAKQFFEDLSSINEVKEQHELIRDLYEKMAIHINWIHVVREDIVLSALSPQPCLLLLDSQCKSSCLTA
ncbi:unnamed protein product [Alternaria alternata]